MKNFSNYTDYDKKENLHFESKAVHGALGTEPLTGAVSMPIFQAVTYRHPALGESTGFAYSRLENPTRQELERTMAILEGGIKAFAFSSGQAANMAVFSLLNPGDHVVLSDDIYQVSVNGLVSGLFLMDDDYNRFDGDDNQGITFYAKAGTLNFKVFLSQCNTNYFRIVSATLPKYNHYSQSDLCQSLRDYHLDFCGEWYQGDMSMDLLLEKAGPYLDQMSDDEEQISILSFVRQHIFWFAGGGVVLLLLILFLIIRYRKRYILD